MKEIKWKSTTIAATLALVFSGFGTAAWSQTGQTPLPGSSIPQFVDPLPVLDGTLGTDNMELLVGPSSNALAPTELFMKEFLVPILPATTPFAVGTVYDGTSVFGYRLNNATTTADTYIGPVLVTSRGTPSAIKYINNLGSTETTNVNVWKTSVDQTLHWANPNDLPMGDEDRMDAYAGPIPAVPHKHGGEEPAAIDGGPDAWFLSDPTGWGTGYDTAWDSYSKHGLGYYTFDYDTTADASNNYCIYRHLNQQEAGPLWFHDHLLGGTRINVYAGLAGAALQIDPTLTLPDGMTAVGLDYDPDNPETDTSLTIPLVIQDRSFDDEGQLYFHDVSDNPDEHPFWVPEFVGDVIVVNGKSWPYLNVEAKRYRFLIIEGSNARPYELFLVNRTAGGTPGPSIYVIGTDGGYLDTPVKINPALKQKLRMMPGERYQIIIDFAGFAGNTLLMRNTARTPYDKGTPPMGNTTGQVMEFRVTAASSSDNSYNPAGMGTIRTNQPIQRLVTTGGALNVDVAQNRQLTLNEVMGPGGPLEILVNNTKWSGERPTSSGPEVISDFESDGIGAWLSELPNEGTTELWEIINLTADAHPIHTHLTQFQILDRQKFNVSRYTKEYEKAFPGGYDFVQDMTLASGAFIPAFGPPMDYYEIQGTSPITGADIIGGNPDITPYLQGPHMPALPQEKGWKDTAIMFPGQVTRIAVRYAPLDTAPATDDAIYPFTPNDSNPNAIGVAGNYYNYDYVWHCHIVDHEDNEMMRPYQVTPADAASRDFDQGTDY